MSSGNSKLIGVFAFIPPANAVCDGKACVIAGSESAMKEYLAVAAKSEYSRIVIKKTVFREIATGLSLGAEYAFDRAAYNRFAPLAKKAGYKLPECQFDDGSLETAQFVHVKK